MGERREIKATRGRTVKGAQGHEVTLAPDPVKRRVVTISVLLPVTCVLEVESSDEESDYDDWQIKGVRRLDCSASARTIGEQMDVDTMEELIRLAKISTETP